MKTHSETAARRTRNTQQRKAVLNAIQALEGSHPTAADIYRHVRLGHPQMSLATVYRALHALVEQNAVTEMRVENMARYDCGPVPHHHLICRKCGSVTDIGLESLPPQFLIILQGHFEASGFQVDPFPVQFMGLCQNCLIGATQ